MWPSSSAHIRWLEVLRPCLSQAPAHWPASSERKQSSHGGPHPPIRSRPFRVADATSCASDSSDTQEQKTSIALAQYTITVTDSSATQVAPKYTLGRSISRFYNLLTSRDFFYWHGNVRTGFSRFMNCNRMSWRSYSIKLITSGNPIRSTKLAGPYSRGCPPKFAHTDLC